MESERYQIGLKRIIKMEGEIGVKVIEKMNEVCPDFVQYLLEFVFCDIYGRPGLDMKTKEIINIVSMATMCGTLQLKIHIGNALKMGCTKQEIIEIMLHILPVAGFVRSMDGLLTAKEIFKEMGIE